MTEVEFLGMLVVALVTLGGFIAVIVKFTQPINDLRVVIQKLNDKLDNLEKQSNTQDAKVEKIEGRVESIDNRLGDVELKIKIYHKDS